MHQSASDGIGTTSLQRLLLAGLPLGVSWYLSEPAHCFDVGAAARAEPGQRQRHALLRVVDGIADELAMMCRAMYLLLLFAPAALLAPICVGLGWGRRDWLLLVRWTLERAGPAFIKWGQWAATRPDMFPTDLCDVLASLQTGQPVVLEEYVCARCWAWSCWWVPGMLNDCPSCMCSCAAACVQAYQAHH